MRIRAIPLGALVALLFGLSAIALGQPSAPAKGDIEGLTFGAKADSKPAPRTFAIETFVSRTYNYLDNMVDKDGLPYFNIFWTDPAEAAHDWPDFGDVMSRQLQAAIMARHLTGKEAQNEKLWTKKVLSYLDPTSGLLMRPKTSFSEPVADLGDQALTLYALVTAYADTKAPELKSAIDKMVDHLPKLYEPKHWLRGFIVKSLMTWVRLTDSKPALEQAGKLVQSCFDENPLFTPDNTFRQGGHMHGNLRTLVGAADYALYVKDPLLFSRVDALYRYVRSEGTRFGFLPEVIGRKGDIVSCETCALMDFVGLGVTLANNGHPEYWGDVERVLRNQFVESQLADGSWLRPGNKPDTEQFTWRDVGARMVGGYSGWTSPTHILAAREGLHWGGPELRGKARAIQNCCGGSGTHGFFIAWKNASRFENGTLSVHLQIDKLLPQAEIRCYQPYKGLVTIDLKQPCKVRVRIPEFVEPKEIKAKSNQGRGKGEGRGELSGTGRSTGRGEAGRDLPGADARRGDRHRQPWLPAVPLPCNVERRYCGPNDAGWRAGEHRILRLRRQAGRGLLRRGRPWASLPTGAHAGKGRTGTSVPPHG